MLSQLNLENLKLDKPWMPEWYLESAIQDPLVVNLVDMQDFVLEPMFELLKENFRAASREYLERVLNEYLLFYIFAIIIQSIIFVISALLISKGLKRMIEKSH